MIIHTAQYAIKDKDRFDITRKGNDLLGVHFAPSWKLILDYKENKISEKNYIKEYIKILNNIDNNIILKLLSKERIVFTCFCKANTFCHRYLLKDWFLDNYSLEYNIIYKGEILKSNL